VLKTQQNASVADIGVCSIWSTNGRT